MKPYESMVDADLKAQGFTYDCNPKDDCLECAALNLMVTPDDFEVIQVHRFEGMTDPEDQSVLYAITSKNGVKGTLVNGYGIYSDPISDKLMAKLHIAY